MKKKNAFTLIEIIAVLVILAIIALIVTPLAMNIVKKAKDSADKRSVDAYGKAIELAIAEYLLDTGDYPNTIEDLTVEYTGNEVACNVKKINDNGTVYLSECRVDGVLVKDDKTGDNYYHYDSNSYKSYNIGDKVTYNGMDFYVIANSDKTKDSVTLLKAEPLTTDEVNTYGVGHINKYTSSSQETIYDWNGYGAIAYYTSATCGMVDYNWITNGCTTDYNKSEIKYVVDAWSVNKLNSLDLKKDSLGYKTRLLTFEELTTNLGYVRETDKKYLNTETTPSWVYKYSYWTMSQVNNLNDAVWRVNTYGELYNFGVGYYEAKIRPVITLKKSAIES